MKKTKINSTRKMDEPPTMEELECLIGWPRGTVGYEHERQLLKTLVDLCKEHGFGRVPQLTEQIGIIWRTPEKVEGYQEQRKKQFEFMGWIEE